MIKKITKFVKILPVRLFHTISGSPRHYWHWVILFFFLFFVAIISFSIFVYYSATKMIIIEPSAEDDYRHVEFNKSALEEVLTIISERAKKSSDILESEPLRDPSL